MNSKISFYILSLALLGASIYVGAKLFLDDSANKSPSRSAVENGARPAEGHKLSNSMNEHSAPNVWADPRLKDATGETSVKLKEKAEIDNNLKNLAALYDQGADSEFLSLLKKLIAENPDVREYVALLGDYYYNDGNWPEAETAVKRLIELDPQNNFAKTAYAEILAIQGRYEDAIKINQQVLESDPSNVDAMMGVVSSYDMTGNRAAGVKFLEDRFKANPNNGNIGSAYAETLFMEGKIDEAKNVYQTALKSDPSNPVLNATAAALEARTGNFSAAIKLSSVAFENEKSDARKVQALHTSWQSKLEIKDVPGAISDLKKILEIDPKNAVARQALTSAEAMLTKKGS